jgi:bifunctional ADP-heptose synthase (sugar kinase/adenylyltransferase)
MRYLRHLLKGGSLGTPRHFRSQRFLDWPETSWGWRQYKDKAGAGDLYASGFLYGLSRGLGLATCGRLGSVAAAEVISHVGARPVTPLADLTGAVRA